MEKDNYTRILENIHPTLEEYYGNLTPLIISSLFIALFIVILNIAIFSTTVSRATKHLTNYLLFHTVFLCAPYPIISIAAFGTLIFPKMWLVSHTVMHLSFTAGAVVLHSLFFRYVGSENKYLKEVGDSNDILNMQTPPFCCCCKFLPTVAATPRTLRYVKFLVWQMPLVQTCVMIILNSIYYSEPHLYKSGMLYSGAVIIASIIFGVWGLNMTVKMVGSVLPEYNLKKKMFCLQLILLLCKFQYVILDTQLDLVNFGGSYPITNIIYKQSAINLLILVEMIPVSIMVRNAYSKPVEYD